MSVCKCEQHPSQPGPQAAPTEARHVGSPQGASATPRTELGGDERAADQLQLTRSSGHSP